MQRPQLTPFVLTLAISLACFAAHPALAQTAATPADDAQSNLIGNFKTRQEAISYAIGVTTARNLVKDGVEFDTALVLKGMQDALTGQRLQLNEREVKSVMNGLLTEMRQKMAANRHEAEGINKKKGEEFRANFAKEAGVKTLSNGVLVKAAKTGTGPTPTEEDTIQVSYRGTTIDGKEFDGTAPGKTAPLKMTQLIMGWRETVKQMPVGSRWTLVIPPNLAYGVRGVGADIGPNETLVFDIELFNIIKGN